MKNMETMRTLATYESPGAEESFVVDEEVEKFDDKRRIYFHSMVAKFLYLLKCARPDILTVVIFLCTRVQYTKMEDENKYCGYDPTIWLGASSMLTLSIHSFISYSTLCCVCGYILPVL
jgi:hypothetical protein